MAKLDKETLERMKIPYKPDIIKKEESKPLVINKDMDDVHIISIGLMKSFHDDSMRDITITINSGKMNWVKVKRGKEKEYLVNMINSIGGT